MAHGPFYVPRKQKKDEYQERQEMEFVWRGTKSFGSAQVFGACVRCLAREMRDVCCDIRHDVRAFSFGISHLFLSFVLVLLCRK